MKIVKDSWEFAKVCCGHMYYPKTNLCKECGRDLRNHPVVRARWISKVNFFGKLKEEIIEIHPDDANQMANRKSKNIIIEEISSLLRYPMSLRDFFNGIDSVLDRNKFLIDDSEPIAGNAAIKVQFMEQGKAHFVFKNMTLEQMIALRDELKKEIKRMERE